MKASSKKGESFSSKAPEPVCGKEVMTQSYRRKANWSARNHAALFQKQTLPPKTVAPNLETPSFRVGLTFRPRSQGGSFLATLGWMI